MQLVMHVCVCVYIYEKVVPEARFRVPSGPSSRGESVLSIDRMESRKWTGVSYIYIYVCVCVCVAL